MRIPWSWRRSNTMQKIDTVFLGVLTSNVCTLFEFGKMWVGVVAQFSINCRWFIRIGILNKQQWAQEVLTIYTRSVTMHKNRRMIPIWRCKFNQIKSMLSQATKGLIDSTWWRRWSRLDQLVCGWCKSRDNYQLVSNWRMCWALNT